MWSRSILVPFYLEVSLSFFLFLDFIAISDCVFNNKNNCVHGHTGYQKIITILVISSTPSLYANLRVATRVYDVEGGAIFSKNSTFVYFDGVAWTLRLRSPSPIMAPGLGKGFRFVEIRFWISRFIGKSEIRNPKSKSGFPNRTHPRSNLNPDF